MDGPFKKDCSMKSSPPKLFLRTAKGLGNIILILFKNLQLKGMAETLGRILRKSPFFFFIQISGDYGNMGCQVFKGGTKLDRFLPKNKHIQRKLLNFENWVSF